MWNGNLTIDLAAQKITMTSTSGGEIPTTTATSTLEISDGGALDGSDMYGGGFFANLSGKLDCAPDAGPPYHLTATLSNGGYKNAFFQIPIVGNLAADYQEGGAGTPPMLVNGEHPRRRHLHGRRHADVVRERHLDGDPRRAVTHPASARRGIRRA